MCVYDHVYVCGYGYGIIGSVWYVFVFMYVSLDVSMSTIRIIILRLKTAIKANIYCAIYTCCEYSMGILQMMSYVDLPVASLP